MKAWHRYAVFAWHNPDRWIAAVMHTVPLISVVWLEEAARHAILLIWFDLILASFCAGLVIGGKGEFFTRVGTKADNPPSPLIAFALTILVFGFYGIPFFFVLAWKNPQPWLATLADPALHNAVLIMLALALIKMLMESRKLGKEARSQADGDLALAWRHIAGVGVFGAGLLWLLGDSRPAFIAVLALTCGFRIWSTLFREQELAKMAQTAKELKQYEDEQRKKRGRKGYLP